MFKRQVLKKYIYGIDLPMAELISCINSKD